MSCELIVNDSRGVYGYLVRRMIGGEVHSKFFSLIDKTRQVRGPHATRHAKLSGEARERVHARAKKHDEELRVQQRIYREISVFAARPSKRAHPANTVKGIRYCPDRPGVAKARGAGRVLEPGFMVSAHDREGRPFTEYCAISQPLTEASWEKAWMKAVRALVERKLPKRVQDAAALILRKPEIVETLRLSGELGPVHRQSILVLSVFSEESQIDAKDTAQ